MCTSPHTRAAAPPEKKVVVHIFAMTIVAPKQWVWSENGRGQEHAKPCDTRVDSHLTRKLNDHRYCGVSENLAGLAARGAQPHLASDAREHWAISRPVLSKPPKLEATEITYDVLAASRESAKPCPNCRRNAS